MNKQQQRGQGFYSFNYCSVERVSSGAAYVQRTAAEIPLSMQLLKRQEPCPLFEMVTLSRPLSHPLPGGRRPISSCLPLGLPHFPHRPLSCRRNIFFPFLAARKSGSDPSVSAQALETAALPSHFAAVSFLLAANSHN